MGQYIGEISSTDAQNVVDILHTWGQLERDRREAELTRVILQGTSSGKGMDQIIADVLQTEAAQGQDVGGITGFFRGIGSRFMPPGGSPTMQILARLGLGQTMPQAQAELQGTQAMTEQRKTQTEATRQGMSKSKAHGQIDLDQAEADLSKTRAEVEKMKKENDPAWMEAEYYSNMAVMQLNRLRHQKDVLGVDDSEYEKGMSEAMAGYTGALDQMQQAWQRFQSRQKQTAPGEAPTQAPQGTAAEPRVNVDDAVAWTLADPQRAAAYWSDVLAKQGYGERDIQEFSQILATGDRARIQAALSRIRIE